MITSIVGRLIKKPETVDRINIPGKHLVNFTVVQNSTHGDKRLSVFFNLSMVIGTENQYNLAMRFEKGTVLLFSAPRITFVRQTERGEGDQSINIYAEVENFKIVAGMDMASASGSLSPAEEAPAPQQSPSPQPRRAPLDEGDTDLGDPFEETPAPVSPPAKRSASQSAAARPPARRAALPPTDAALPPTDDDLAALGDPFAE